MADLDDIADRLAITDLFTKYALAIDTSQYDLLDEVFAPDADIDYSAMGGAHLPFAEMKPWLEKTITNVHAKMHLLGNISVKVTGDTAIASAYLFNAMAFTADSTMLIGGKYNDTLVRTHHGWRVTSRQLDMSWKA